MSNRCLYTATFAEFLNQSPLTVLGALHNNYHGDSLTTTDEAWMGEITLMQQVLEPRKDEAGQIVFEYDIPRLGKRIDVVLLLRGMIFCLEFKVGKKEEFQAGIEQVMDYALYLKNFHLFSHDRKIVPILIPTRYKEYTTVFQPSVYNDDIYNPMITGEEHLQELIARVLEHAGAERSDEVIDNWLISPYAPTPTIIEAARTLFENHSVEDITRHEADKVSTDQTINYILDVIQQSKERRQKSICFVTGVPGAGKTLVELDVAIKQTYKDGELDKENGAVYLSGNGPLVAVLTEALACDNQKKCSAKSEKEKHDGFASRSERVHTNHPPLPRQYAGQDKESCGERRGGNRPRKGGTFGCNRIWRSGARGHFRRGATQLDAQAHSRLPEAWRNIWQQAEGDQFPDVGSGVLDLVARPTRRLGSHHLSGGWRSRTEPEYAEGRVNDLLQENDKVTYSDELHLAVSLRSFRAETLSAFVHSLLSFAPDAASLYRDVKQKGYPIVLTRDMEQARAWLRKLAHGSQQTGVLVTKVAARFKPLAVHILGQGDENAVHWFPDIRSSNYLEDAATEIQVQGLELDYACVLWDADMRCEDGCWTYYKFNGKNKWNPENNEENRKYMLNAYRVLLTRARQGIVICVPTGNGKLGSDGFPEDPTRLPEFYNGTYKYLKSLGLEEI